MSEFVQGSCDYAKSRPTALLDALLRVIDAGGEHLRVLAVNGWRVTGDPTFRWEYYGDADVVALWFGEAETEGIINRNAAQASIRALKDGKRMALVGVKRGKISHAVQQACSWVIY